MAKRRSSSEGTVFRLPDGRWAAVIELPRHPSGNRNRRKRETSTKAEAQALLKQMRRDLDDFGALPKLGRTMNQSLDDYTKHVLDAQRSGWSTNARNDGFAGAVSGYLGDRKTANLTVHDIDAFLVAFASGRANASGRPVGRDYVKRARGYLINVLRNEMRLGYVNRNVAELCVLLTTTKQKATKRALTVDEWRKLYDAAKSATKLSIDLSGRQGLRPQEARSLRWSAVDLDQGTVSVINQFDSDDEFVDPKTTDSARTIRLHSEAADLLTGWQHTQTAMRRRAGDLDRAGPHHHYPVRHGDSTRELPALTPRPMHPARRRSDHAYELRHTAITYQVDTVGSAGPVADWAGTSEAMIRRHYRHALREVLPLPPPSFAEDT